MVPWRDQSPGTAQVPEMYLGTLIAVRAEGHLVLGRTFVRRSSVQRRACPRKSMFTDPAETTVSASDRSPLNFGASWDMASPRDRWSLFK